MIHARFHFVFPRQVNCFVHFEYRILKFAQICLLNKIFFPKGISDPVIAKLRALQPHYTSAENLITFIGLDKEPVILDPDKHTHDPVSWQDVKRVKDKGIRIESYS